MCIQAKEWDEYKETSKPHDFRTEGPRHLLAQRCALWQALYSLAGQSMFL